MAIICFSHNQYESLIGHYVKTDINIHLAQVVSVHELSFLVSVFIAFISVSINLCVHLTNTYSFYIHIFRNRGVGN